MKILKYLSILLVSYIQNLQNDKFYSCKIKLVYSMFVLKKNFETSCHGQVQKAIIYNTIIIYNIHVSVKPKSMWPILAGFNAKIIQIFSSISPKLCILCQKNIGTLVVLVLNVTIICWLRVFGFNFNSKT